MSATPAGEKFVRGDVPGGHTRFGPGITFATTAGSGTLTVIDGATAFQLRRS